VKRHADGTVEQHKARLVGNDFNQLLTGSPPAFVANPAISSEIAASSKKLPTSKLLDVLRS
jgi:hypothetical protein